MEMGRITESERDLHGTDLFGGPCFVPRVHFDSCTEEGPVVSRRKVELD